MSSQLFRVEQIMASHLPITPCKKYRLTLHLIHGVLGNSCSFPTLPSERYFTPVLWRIVLDPPLASGKATRIGADS